jgi:spore coat polysaccharide biosynthesis protein SpsF
MSAAVRIFVQARMTSRRLPGKVLASLAGRPMIDHVLERCAQALGRDAVVLATSTDASDDRLAQHVAATGFAVYRGDLADVVARFRGCLAAHPCDWFVRISGDSPIIDPALIAAVARLRNDSCDLVCNVQKRTFPAGQSVEVVRAAAFLSLDPASLTGEEREHVTTALYRRRGYRVCNVESRDPALGGQQLSVDTAEDLRRIEALLAAGQVPAFAHAVAQPA